MRVAKWRNCLAVRLPPALVEVPRLKPGDEIEVHVAGQPVRRAARRPEPEDWLIRLRAFRGRLPPDFKFDRDEANARADSVQNVRLR